jgi:L-lactate dehydrogenase (cytochrome)
VKAADVTDYRELARRRLPRFLFEYIDGGSYAEVTLRRNVSDLEAVALRQRVMRDVSVLDLTTELFGTLQAMPLALGPVGIAGLNARRGEVQAARAAERAGVPFCLSTVSACPLAEVAGAVQRPFWFQLYLLRDRAFMRDLLAEAARHCSVLVFTVDLPVSGSRYRDVRSGFAESLGVMGTLRRAGQALRRPRWAWDVGVQGRPFVLGNLTPIM